MNKISIKLNIDKINKSKIKTRSYTNKSGANITVREYEVEVVPIREEKVVHSTDKFDFVKIGFVSDRSVKRPDGSWEDGTILGDAIEIRTRTDSQEPADDEPSVQIGGYNMDDIIDPDEIPF